jgi:hypothetical protein
MYRSAANKQQLVKEENLVREFCDSCVSSMVKKGLFILFLLAVVTFALYLVEFFRFHY